MGVLLGSKKKLTPAAVPPAPAPATAANTAAASQAAAADTRSAASAAAGRQSTISNKGGALGLSGMVAAIKKLKLGA